MHVAIVKPEDVPRNRVIGVPLVILWANAVVKTPVVATVVIGIASGVTVIVVGFVKAVAPNVHTGEQVTEGESWKVFVETTQANIGVVAYAAYEATAPQEANVGAVEVPRATEIGVPDVIESAAAAVAVKTPVEDTTDAMRIARGVATIVVGFESVPVNVQSGEHAVDVATLKTLADATHAKRGVVASAAYDATEQPAIT